MCLSKSITRMSLIWLLGKITQGMVCSYQKEQYEIYFMLLFSCYESMIGHGNS